jgi:hypothetical protein
VAHCYETISKKRLTPKFEATLDVEAQFRHPPKKA